MIYQNAVAVPRDELSDFVMEGATKSQQFIGLQVLGAYPLTQLTGHYPKITIANGDLLRATASKRMPGTSFDRWKAGIEDGTVTLNQIAEELPIPDEVSLSYEDYFPTESVFAMQTTARLQRAIELSSAIAVQDSTNFTTTAATVNWTVANKATSTPISDILDAIARIRAVGEDADTIVFNDIVWRAIRQSTEMRNFIAGSVNPGAIVTPNTLQSALSSEGIKKVLIGSSYVNFSAPGANDNILPAWSSTTAWVGATGTGALASGGVGRVGFWDKEGPMFNIQTYRDETIKSNIIRGISTYQAFIANYRAGQLITTGL